MNTKVEARAEEIARASYGKLLAILSSRTGDIALAEDALAEAFTRALSHWPGHGIPENPEAWLLTTARNKMLDLYKSAAYRTSVTLQSDEPSEPIMTGIDPYEIPDERLKLLFVCAHPAIDDAVRTPLMLQTVLRVEARKIAAAFLVPPATMAQRLVRSKQKIRDARIPFVVPEKSQMSARLDAVLEAIYAAYAIDWNPSMADDDLSTEALFLADLLAELLPDEAEVLGLAALINFSSARRSPDRLMFAPLADQDTSTWDHSQCNRAEGLLMRAKRLNKLGRFQIEAAIQAVHADRRHTGETDWNALVQLYSGLVAISPTIGSAVALAAAVGQAHGPVAGLAQLDRIDEKAQQTHQPAWATRAHLLAAAGNPVDAANAYDRAISMTDNDILRQYLENQRRRLEN